MSDFVWILTSDKNTSFGESGVFGSYIIPQGDMKISPESLSGHRLWVLLRGNEDRILLSLKIKKIEKIIEGYHSGDFLTSVDLLSSFRLVSKYSEAVKYVAQNTPSFSNGISKISADQSSGFFQMIINNIGVKMVPPGTKLFSNVDTKILPRSNQSLAQAALRAVVAHFNLNDIWAEGVGRKLGAFPNFANTLISKNVSPENRDRIVDFLKFFDPLKNLSKNQDKTVKDISPINLSSPKVDIDFTEIDPKKIYAREFISAENEFSEPKDLAAALIKIENAEKMHQEMLKDIAEFLISKRIVPYESGSIDLMYQLKNKTKICEIKSATLDNLLDQSSRGAFQLTRYVEEVEKDYDAVFPRLILRRAGNEETEAYVKNILSRMNIPIFYYDPDKPWPDRLPGLLS